MRVSKTLIIIFIAKLYKFWRWCRMRVYKYRLPKKLQMETPTICESRQEKDEIILATIKHLESNIKIN